MFGTLIFWFIFLTGLTLWLGLIGSTLYVLVDEKRRRRVFTIVSAAQQMAQSRNVAQRERAAVNIVKSAIVMQPPPSTETCADEQVSDFCEEKKDK